MDTDMNMDVDMDNKPSRGRKKEAVSDVEKYERQKARVRQYQQNIRDNAKKYIEAMKKKKNDEEDNEEIEKILKENEDILEEMLEKILLKREALKNDKSI